jgi:hypothetical protein
MPVPVVLRLSRPDSDVIRIPDLSEYLSLVGGGDAAVWASFVDYKANTARVQK